MNAIIVKQNSPSEIGELIIVPVKDIHQIESGDSMIAEGCLEVVLKDLTTRITTYSPIRFYID